MTVKCPACLETWKDSSDNVPNKFWMISDYVMGDTSWGEGFREGSWIPAYPKGSTIGYWCQNCNSIVLDTKQGYQAYEIVKPLEKMVLSEEIK